jgi:hypothetical protein
MLESTSTLKRWLFRTTVVNKAGAMTSIASTFSNHGISIDSIVGHGAEETPGDSGTVLVTCRCSDPEKEVLSREIKRLSKVLQLEEHVYREDYLRKGAMLLIKPGTDISHLIGANGAVNWELIKDEIIGHTYFLSGPPYLVDPIIDELLADGLLLDIVYAVITL